MKREIVELPKICMFCFHHCRTSETGFSTAVWCGRGGSDDPSAEDCPNFKLNNDFIWAFGLIGKEIKR